MSDDVTLLPDLPRPSRRYEVTVIVPRRPDGDCEEESLPPGGHAMLQLAAAALAGEGVVSAWTCSRTIVAMLVDAVCWGDALDAGVAVARSLSGGDGAVTVTAEPFAAGVSEAASPS